MKVRYQTWRAWRWLRDLFSGNLDGYPLFGSDFCEECGGVIRGKYRLSPSSGRMYHGSCYDPKRHEFWADWIEIIERNQ
jgi:hypothetical protein